MYLECPRNSKELEQSGLGQGWGGVGWSELGEMALEDWIKGVLGHGM